jgi:hypothetical protein
MVASFTNTVRTNLISIEFAVVSVILGIYFLVESQVSLNRNYRGIVYGVLVSIFLGSLVVFNMAMYIDMYLAEIAGRIIINTHVVALSGAAVFFIFGGHNSRNSHGSVG